MKNSHAQRYKAGAAIVILIISYSLSTISCSKTAVAQKKAASLDSLTVKEWVFHLASDEMKGRQNGSEEMKVCAEWIAGKFKEFGLKTPPGQDNYFQEYSFNSRRSGAEIHERNIVGYLEGNDPELKNEYIIITAHFDHIGIGQEVAGDSIYNGADDNATGTTGVISLAKMLSNKQVKLGRSLVFIAFSGEEMGLQGSRYYCKNAIFPLEKTWLNVNLEMLAHSEGFGKRRYLLTGPSYSDFDDLVKKFNETSEWAMVDTFAMADRLFRASYHAAFAYARRVDDEVWGVHAHTFAITDDGDHIHRPHDEAQFADYENMASFLEYMSGFVLHLSQSREEINWTDEKFHRYEKLE